MDMIVEVWQAQHLAVNSVKGRRRRRKGVGLGERGAEEGGWVGGGW